METTENRKIGRMLSILVWVLPVLFVLASILPGRPFLFAPRKFLYLSLIVLLWKAFWNWRYSIRSRYLEILPFLLFFLISAQSFSRFPQYGFGVDDAYYYSYMRSVWIDGDLDLSNEYELSGLNKFLDQRTRESKTPAGYSPNVFPVGLSLFWTPFFWFGHLLAKLFTLPMDGFSRVYTHTVGMGNLLYACAGLYFCYRFCSAFFEKGISFFLTAALLLTTPHLWLFFRSFLLISEPLSLSAIALFLFCIHHLRDDRTIWKWSLLGLLLGAITMIRFHNALIGIVPVVLFGLESFHKKKVIGWECLLALTCGAIVGFVPQLITWRILNGEWFVSMGEKFLPFWKSPFFLETLFAARKGLFPWSPVVLLCIPGLFLFFRKNREWAWALVLALLAMIWVNSAQADWWGATSLGSRRFVPAVSIFVVGLAALYSIFGKAWRIILCSVLCAFILLNVSFVSAFRSAELQPEHADRFSDILTGPSVAYKPLAYALQFPVQLAYKIRYGIPMYAPWNEYFIGEDVFYFQKRINERILSEESPMFGKGWSIQNGIRRTTGQESILYVPLFMKEKPRIVIEFTLLPAANEKNVWVDFYWNGEFLRSRKVPSDGRQLDMSIRSRSIQNEMNLLTLRVYSSKSEEKMPSLLLRNIVFRPPRSLAEMLDAEP